jgi:flagellar biosynthesis protein FlhG
MKTIIPVASGKGGVGKTFLTANIAIALAKKEHSTIVVDLDLGNSNLYTFLGLPTSTPGIGDFLRSQAESLEAFKVKTEIPLLHYIAGDGLMPLMADITYHQKQKIIKEIKRLKADYILLDLGAGSHNDILDLFGIADRGLIITVPEHPSIISMLVFLKNFMIRMIDRLTKDDLKLIPIMQEIYNQPTDGPPRTVRIFKDKIAGINPEIESKISEKCSQIRPRFIYNMGDSPRDLELLPKIDNTLISVFSIVGDHLGFVFYHPEVLSSIRAGVPLLLHSPNGLTARSIRQIATRIIKAWDVDILESASRLEEHTTRVYEKRVMEEKLYST